MRITRFHAAILTAAGAGILFAGRAASQTAPVPQALAPLVTPAVAPFQRYLGGAGMIEAGGDNVAIGTPVAGIVKQIWVEAGQAVEKGTPLFALDDRDVLAEREVRRAELAKARAALLEAQASVADYRAQYALVADEPDDAAVSRDERQRRQFALASAQAREQSAKAAQQVAEANVLASERQLERLVVRSPLRGSVLSRNLRVGEYAQAGAVSTPLLRLGNAQTLQVRVDIDENDAWRFQSGSRAVLYVRGNPKLQAPLRFVRVEPFVTGKTALTGSSTERVDTRVLQLIYQFPRDALPVYIGQQVDVFVEVSDTKPAVATPDLQPAATLRRSV